MAMLSPRKGAKAILLQGYEISPGEEDPEMDHAWRSPLRKIVVSKWLMDSDRGAAFSFARASADVTESRFRSVSAQGTQTPAIPPGIRHSRRAAARTRAMPVSSRNRFIVTPASCQPRNWSTW